LVIIGRRQPALAGPAAVTNHHHMFLYVVVMVPPTVRPQIRGRHVAAKLPLRCCSATRSVQLTLPGSRIRRHLAAE
jgi:hypothetical protein